MLTRVLFVVASLLASATASCVTSGIHPLPAYDACLALPPAAEPRFVWANEIDVKGLSTMVPYAYVSVSSRNKSAATDALQRKCEGVDPDLVVMDASGSYYGGTFTKNSGGIGGGTYASDPTYRQTYLATCYRRAPGDLGLRWDELGTIRSLDETARASGIREGDKIVSIAGVPVEYGEGHLNSPHWVKLLTLKPGDVVTIEWDRSGMGSMNGTMTCGPSTSAHGG